MPPSGHKSFKSGIDLGTAARRRDEMSLSLRNKKREEMMEKKRRDDESRARSASPSADEESISSPHPRLPEATLDDLPAIIEMIRAPEIERVTDGLVALRKMVSSETNPPFNEVLQSGVMPDILKNLNDPNHPSNQVEAAWIITNIASGNQEHTHAVVKLGVVQHLVHWMQSPSTALRDQCVWAIGNIVGDCSKCRNHVIEQGGLQKFFWILNETQPNIQLVRNIVWALSNFCRGKPAPVIDVFKAIIPVLVSLLHHEDEEVSVDAVWGLSYISDGPNDRIDMVLNANVLPTIVQFLSLMQSDRQLPAIRTIGNLVTGTDEQTQAVIDAGALTNFHYLINSPKRHIRKETCWTISNVAAGTHSQINAVIQSGLLPPVITQLSAPEFEVRKEAAWVISNIAAAGDAEQIKYVIDLGPVPPLCELLTLHDAKATIVALEALDNFLRIGKDEAEQAGGDVSNIEGFISNDETNPIASIIIDCGGLSKIDELQSHQNDEVYSLASDIIDKYFTWEEETDEAMDNEEQEAQRFSF